ncbi:MAG: topoisomerase C-terminal repeat-containing protein [Clostridia bacterium]|nr:topoisomerase C-terminal repeat-containing protein [Clostridia bacterium]
MTLIIAEKPSLALNIVAGIGDMKKKNGYFEGCGYYVSWAFGHLFELCDIEEYRPLPQGQKFWTMDNLPCFPEEFRYQLRRDKDKRGQDDGVLRQFRVLEELCNCNDVDRIVNAGDADREGEIIVRTCIEKALKSPKPLYRLWLPDQTPETVAAALQEMKPEEDYRNLANEGYARTYIDWLYGVNLTRYATLKSGTLLRVGRVIVPIVRAIYDRDMAIRNFVPDIYYALVSKAETDGQVIELQSKTKFQKTEFVKAQNLADAYNAVGAVVTSVKRKKDTLSPGKLYSLSKLQNVLGKKYKMSMAESLEIVQKLYEEGYLTYPRTNSEYLATAEKDKIKKIIENAKKLGYPLAFKDKKTIFDDSKIESHSALTPTYKIPDKSRLTEREMQVYSTVFRRFAAVFCAEDCVVDKTEIKIAVGDYEEFTLKGTVIVEKGWTKYDDYHTKDKILPKLNKGDAVNIAFAPVEKETTPPKHYTIETLNNYLKNPFKTEKAAQENADPDKIDDAEDYRAIFEGLELGTEATRTGIIDNARKSGYIHLNKDVYTILPGGEYLIESLGRMQISMDKYKTAEMGKALKKVFRGEMSVSDSVEVAKAEIAEVFAAKTVGAGEDADIGFFRQPVGTCPLCGGEVRRTTFGYGCGAYRENGCKFSIHMAICGRTIPGSAVKQLLATGKTEKLNGFVSKKSGKSFDGALKLEDGRVVFDFS